MFVWFDLVSKFAARPKGSRRWNDAEEETNVHDAQWTPRVLCAEHAAWTDELHWQKSRALRSHERIQVCLSQLFFEYINFSRSDEMFNIIMVLCRRPPTVSLNVSFYFSFVLWFYIFLHYYMEEKNIKLWGHHVLFLFLFIFCAANL